MAYVGLLVPSVEVINNASFVVIFPLTFVSNAFVPTESFDGILRTFVLWNPVSTLTQACRELFGNLGANPTRLRRLVDAAPGDLHADLGGDHPRRVRPAVGAPVPPLHQQVDEA